MTTCVRCSISIHFLLLLFFTSIHIFCSTLQYLFICFPLLFSTHFLIFLSALFSTYLIIFFLYLRFIISYFSFSFLLSFAFLYISVFLDDYFILFIILFIVLFISFLWFSQSTYFFLFLFFSFFVLFFFFFFYFAYLFILCRFLFSASLFRPDHVFAFLFYTHLFVSYALSFVQSK